MQTNKHWVFQTPEKFLTNYNSTQITQEQQHNSPTTIYTQLSVRVFLFFKGSILLCKRDNKWEIPEFGYTSKCIHVHLKTLDVTVCLEYQFPADIGL